MPCIIKFDHEDGKKLRKSKIVTWCGKEPSNWMFCDAQHAALATEQGSRIAVCRSCRTKIKQALYGEH